MGCFTSPLDKVLVGNYFSLDAFHKPRILLLELDSKIYTLCFFPK
jgi:hypothetical protein